MAGPSTLSTRVTVGGERLRDVPNGRSFLERTAAEDEMDDSAEDASAPASAPVTAPGPPPTTSDKSAARNQGRSGWIRFGIVVVVAVIAAFGLRTYVVAPYYIPSASMEPTLHGCTGCDNDHVLVDKLSYHLHSVHRGDVVVFNRPKTWTVPENVLIKRVIGLPGDTLTVRTGHVYVNGQQLDEPYVNKSCAPITALSESPRNITATTTGKIPSGEVWVMGDNRCNSEDSRAFGPIPISKIIGRAFVIIWPLKRIHYL